MSSKSESSTGKSDSSFERKCQSERIVPLFYGRRGDRSERVLKAKNKYTE